MLGVISEDALRTLLTAYAPNLTVLSVKGIDKDPPLVNNDTGHGGRLLGAVMNALQISRELDREGEPPGRDGVGATTATTTPATAHKDRLLSFTCGYMLSRKDMKFHGLHGIDSREVVKYQAAGKFVILMRHQYYVRQDDGMKY